MTSMARYFEPSVEQQGAWAEWVASRPLVVRDIAERFDPWSLYRMSPRGERVTLHSISENGTVCVTVSGEFNQVLFERNVFGVDPNDLEPCELPPPDEPVGTILTNADVDQHIDTLRAIFLKNQEGAT